KTLEAQKQGGSCELYRRRALSHRKFDRRGSRFYSIVTAPEVSPAAGNVVESIARTKPSAPAITLKATLGSGGVPSPRSSEAVPLKVARPSAATEPSLTFPSTMISRGYPSELPCSTAWNVTDVTAVLLTVLANVP